MSPRTSRLLKVLGYPAFTAFALVVGIYLTFPWERVQTTLVDRLERATEHDVKIGTFRPSLITGVVLEDVTFTSRPQKSEEKPQIYLVERAAARIAVLPLLLGRISVTFQMQALGGELDGKYTLATGSKDTTFSWNADKISLAKVSGALLSKVISIPFFGQLRTSGELAIEGGKPTSTEGRISLACVDCKLGDGKSKLAIPGDAFLAAGITLTQPIRLGEFGGDVTFKEGRGQIESFSGKSKDLEVTLEGHVDLRQPVARSGLKAFLKFKFTDSLKKALTVLELLENQPKLSRAKTADGFFGLAFSGTLTNPNPYPSKIAPSGMNAPKVGRRPTTPGGPRTPPGARPPGTPGRPGRPGAPPLPPGATPGRPPLAGAARPPIPALGSVRPGGLGSTPGNGTANGEAGSDTPRTRPLGAPPAAGGFTRSRFGRKPGDKGADVDKAETPEKGDKADEKPAEPEGGGEPAGEAKPEAPAEEAPAAPEAAPEVAD